MKKQNWHKDIIYQIYPKSFLDTSGNGFGDINGVIEKLDYFKELGVTCLWLSPVFESPMKDNGYDISNYQLIDPIFGTNEDMYRLIKLAKEKGIKIMLDLVVNHTSDQHKWFQEALKGKDNPYRDYYIWRDQKNDINSIFLGDAWEYDEASNQYYFHLFAKEQPDLNWDNKAVREEVYKMMNFWIEKGVGGFRLDVIEFLGKNPDEYITSDGPNLHTYIKEMNQRTFGPNNCITVGESWSATDETAKLYTDPKRNELSMIFRFDQITTFWDQELGKWNRKDFDLKAFKEIVFRRQSTQKQQYWNTLFWGNHDLPRSVSNYIEKGYETVGAKMLFGITAFMSGTPFIFQGDEIGMTNLPLSPEDYRDIEAINAFDMLIKKGYSKEDTISMINKMSRDNARTPMQWTGETNAGFTEKQPWMKINANYKQLNVASQTNQEDSVLNFYKNVISLRKSEEFSDLILYGHFVPKNFSDEKLLIYTRSNEDKQITVYANFSSETTKLSTPIPLQEVVVNNYQNSAVIVELKPYQLVVTSHQ